MIVTYNKTAYKRLICMAFYIPIYFAAAHTRAVDHSGHNKYAIKHHTPENNPKDYTRNTHEADTLGRDWFNSFFSGAHPRCVWIVQLYLKVVLDYILDILYFYNCTIETQWGCFTWRL
jgi:hypothetical protein